MSSPDTEGTGAPVPPDMAAALFAGARDSGPPSSANRPLVHGESWNLRERVHGDRLGERWRATDRETGAEVIVQILELSLDDVDQDACDATFQAVRNAATERMTACSSWRGAEVGDDVRLALVSAAGGARRLTDPACPWVAPRSAVEGCARVARAVDTLHQRGLAHGALSPLTVARDDGGEWHALDLGVAAVLVACGREGRRCLLREPEFLAPELLDGGRITAACDVFGLGAALLWGLAGRRVHALRDEADHAEDLEDSTEPTLAELPTLAAAVAAPAPALAELPHVDEELAQICASALARDPQDRTPSAGGLAAQLEDYLADRAQAPHATLIVRVAGQTHTLHLEAPHLSAGLDADAQLPLPGAAGLAFELVDTGFGWCAVPRERPLLVEETRQGAPLLLRHLSAFECGGASCTFILDPQAP